MPGVDSVGPEEIQRRTRYYRERLLAGRGPGADPQETAPYMRDRQWLGGVPASVARQQEADQAALASENLPAVQDLIIRQRSASVAALAAVSARLAAVRAQAIAALRAALIGAVAAVAVGLAARAALHRLNRSRSFPPRAVREPGARGLPGSLGRRPDTARP